ncbi:MAG: hypothetical protein Q4Q03_05705 [Bowdeniella nasicola]|nr:hypothetical protein [Bowdeniella nasicola]
MSLETARIALQNPQIPAEVMVDIANNFPQLHTEIANHASAYPELLQWLANTSPNAPARVKGAVTSRQVAVLARGCASLVGNEIPITPHQDARC